MAEQVVDDDGRPVGETVGERFISRVLNHAVATGNPALIREIFDRHDGRVPEPPKSADDRKADGVASFRDLIGTPIDDDDNDEGQAPDDPSHDAEAVGGDPAAG